MLMTVSVVGLIAEGAAESDSLRPAGTGLIALERCGGRPGRFRPWLESFRRVSADDGVAIGHEFTGLHFGLGLHRSLLSADDDVAVGDESPGLHFGLGLH